jgi:hypothetical protein
MTMIDEDILRQALRDATNEFHVSDEAIAQILAAGECDDATLRRNLIPSSVRNSGSLRTVLAAAAILVVVSAIAVPLLRSERPSPDISAAKKAFHTPSIGASGLSAATPNGPRPPAAGVKTLTGTGLAISTSQKVESTGSVDLTVTRDRVESTFAKLGGLAASFHGQVQRTQANSSTRSSNSISSGTMVLQVPQHSFARFVADVERVGHASSVTTSSNNVTGQYVDLQARIDALNASLAQYLKIMTKATTISGILAVQNQINTIQSQIEQDRGQLKLLANETTYGSLTVNVSQAGHVSLTRSGFDKAWHGSLHGFVAGFEWLVRLAGPALFALLMLGVLYEIVKYVRRGIRRRRI